LAAAESTWRFLPRWTTLSAALRSNLSRTPCFNDHRPRAGAPGRRKLFDNLAHGQVTHEILWRTTIDEQPTLEHAVDQALRSIAPPSVGRWLAFTRVAAADKRPEAEPFH